MERTWKATTAGILSIIGGIAGIVAGAIALGITTIAAEMIGWFGLGAIGGGFLALGIVALIGGIMTLKRKVWGFALAGAICAMFPFVPLGILAIIFVELLKVLLTNAGLTLERFTVTLSNNTHKEMFRNEKEWVTVIA